MSEQSSITISLSNLLKIIAVGLLLVLLWQLRGLLVVLMIAIVLASALAPMIVAAEKLGIPRWLGVILAYLGLLGIITGAGLIIGPTVVEQIQRLIRKLPNYLEVLRILAENLTIHLGISEPGDTNPLLQFFDTQALTAWAIRSSQQLLIRSYGLTRGIVGGAVSLLLAILLSAYMLGGSERLIRGLVSLFPQPWEDRLANQVHPVSVRMGGYIQGRVLVSSILGIAISISLKFLGLSEFAIGLGVIAGFTNLIPFFGPVLGAIPALLVAVAQGGWVFLWVLLLFVVIQNIETYFLDPLLVGNSVKVHPLYQLLAVLGGAQVLGIIGALIFPPWVAGMAVLLENLYLKPKLLSESSQTETDSLSEEVQPVTHSNQLQEEI